MTFIIRSRAGRRAGGTREAHKYWNTEDGDNLLRERATLALLPVASQRPGRLRPPSGLGVQGRSTGTGCKSAVLFSAEPVFLCCAGE